MRSKGVVVAAATKPARELLAKVTPNVNSPLRDNNPIMSSNGRLLLFGSERADGEGGFDIWMSTRDSIGAEWGPATNLGPSINSPAAEQPSQLWEAGNLLLFKSNGLAGEGGADMFYVNVVPEPSTSAMAMGCLLFAVGLVNNRRRKRK